MGKTLYLCEKPDQARIVAKAIGDADKKGGYLLCGDGSIVTWCFGHLLSPKMPEDYGDEYREWTWDTLPIVPTFGFKPRDGGAGQQLKIIAGLLNQCSDVVISTDPDREGELIAYEVITYLKYNGLIRRLWINDLTIPAVRRALQALRDGAETKPLYHAALARTFADWVVGMNMTRAATLKLRKGRGKPLSVGRVQTPTLALIVRRQSQIENFKPEDYFELVALVRSQSGQQVTMRFAPPAEKRIKNKLQIEQIKGQASGARGPIEVETTQKFTPPPELLSLGKLQQRCNRLFGWSAEHTLQVAQSLYETHQAITYPRTDCSFLPEEHVERIPTIVDTICNLRELQHLHGALAKPQIRKRHYDDKKITAHHAIVPTLQAPQLSRLNQDERNMYILVARHFAAAHLPNYDYLATKMTFNANQVPFVARGSVPMVIGWREAFRGLPAEEVDDTPKGKNADEDDETAGELPNIQNGEAGAIDDIDVQAKQTTPPKRFTEASLLSAMEKIDDYVEDQAAKKRLRQTSGIGTPATRANIIETLKQRDYVRIQKRNLIATEVGVKLIAAMEIVASDYADPATTAQWEDGLDEIANNRANTTEFVKAIAAKVKADVVRVRNATDLPAISDDDSPGGSGNNGNRKRDSAEWDKKREQAIKGGTPLKVSFDDKAEAKALGAMWDGNTKMWIAPPGADLTPFRERGFLT